MNTDSIPNINANNSQNPIWSLIALSPELGDLHIPLSVSTSIGRQQDNDIVLTSQQISRHHAKFNQIGSKLFVQDLGSSNGTFVNGQRIGTQAVELTQNDEVSFADIIFSVMNEAVLENNFMINEITTQQMHQPRNIETPAPVMGETVTALVPLPATVITTSSEQDETNKIETTINQSSLKNHESIPTNGELEPSLAPQTADTFIAPTTAATTESGIQEQAISPVVQASMTTPIIPKNASTQTWLVAIIIIILIVGIIVATLFFK